MNAKARGQWDEKGRSAKLGKRGCARASEAPRRAARLESVREKASQELRQAVCARRGAQEAGGGVQRSVRSAAAPIEVLTQARSARAAWRRPPPPHRTRSAYSGRSSPGRASTSSPSASSTSSSIIASSREEEEEEEEVFAASTRVKAKARADAEYPPVSPEARAAARVDALLAGLGVVVFSPDADRRHVRAAAEPPRRIAPAPGSAPRAASSARGRRALARPRARGGEPRERRTGQG